MKFMLFIYPDLSVELSPEQRAQIPAAVGAWIEELGNALQEHARSNQDAALALRRLVS